MRHHRFPFLSNLVNDFLDQYKSIRTGRQQPLFVSPTSLNALPVPG
jgi:hypothetical protein